jgi:hypothetical protein
MVQICEISSGKFSKSSDCYNKLLYVVKIEGFLSGFFLSLSIFFIKTLVKVSQKFSKTSCIYTRKTNFPIFLSKK